MEQNVRIQHAEFGPSTIAGRTTSGQIVIAPDDFESDVFEIISSMAEAEVLPTPEEVNAWFSEEIRAAKLSHRDLKTSKRQEVIDAIVDAFRTAVRLYNELRNRIRESGLHTKEYISEVSANKQFQLETYNSGRRF